MKIAGTFKSLIGVIPIFMLTAITFFSFITKNPDNDIKTINILKTTDAELNMSEIANNIQYIRLSNDKLLSEIRKIKYAESNFYVIDNKSKLLKFSSNGKFEAEIGRKGNGPGEYRFIKDFTIGEKSGRLFVLISYLKKIFEYNAAGKYVQAISLPLRTSNIEKCNDGFLTFNNISSGNNSISFETIDLQGNILAQFPNKYKFNNSAGRVVRLKGECLFYKFQGKPFLKEIYSDTVFYVENNRMIPNYILNSGKNRFTIETKKILNNGGVVHDVVIQTNIFETNNYLFFEYNNQILVYNKTTLDSYKISKNVGIINDVDGGPNLVFKSVIDDNTLLTWYNALEIKQYVNSNKFKNTTPKYPEKKKELEKMAKGLNENDNPVLMLVKLKNQ